MTPQISGARVSMAVERYEKYLSQGFNKGEARKAASGEFQISEYSLAKASKVKANSSELFQAVVQETWTLSAAYKKVHEPREIQAEPTAKCEPPKTISRLSRRQFEVLSSIAGAAQAIAQTCREVDVETALLAAEPSRHRGFEKALKQASVAINEIRRELRSHAEQKQ